MSKLQQVLAALEKNPNVQVHDIKHFRDVPSAFGWTHTVEIFVAPTDGIYYAEGLQNFMESLIPDIEATTMDRFRNAGGELSIGLLYFDEPMGEVLTLREIKMNDPDDPDFRLGEEFTNGYRLTISRDKVMRRTWVRVYPSKSYALAAMDGNMVHRIPTSSLPKSSRIVNSIFGR